MYGENKYGELMYGENKRTDIPIDDKYKVDLMQYLTSNYHHRDLVQKLMNVLDLEIGELMYYSISLGEQVSVDNATWGLFRWEDDLGIAYNPSLSIEERSEIVKARLRMQGKTTLEMIKNVAEAFSGGEVDVIEYPDEYYFVVKFIGVKGIPRNMRGFIEMLEIIKPAHLGYKFEYKFTTCQMLIDWNVNCNDIKKITCTELKTYEKKFNFAYTTCKYLVDNNVICNDMKDMTCMEIKEFGRSEVI